MGYLQRYSGMAELGHVWFSYLVQLVLDRRYYRLPDHAIQGEHWQLSLLEEQQFSPSESGCCERKQYQRC